MRQKNNIVLISGSLRKDSYNTKILRNFEKEFINHGYNCTFIDLNEYPIPFFNSDIESSGTPVNVTFIKNLIKSSSGLVVSSPEYNGEISAVLKNCLDWLSRKGPNEIPKETFIGLKSIGISVSTGKNAAKRALERLTVLLKRLGVDEDIITYNLGNLSNNFFNEDNILLDNKKLDTINNIIRVYSDSITNINKADNIIKIKAS